MNDITALIESLKEPAKKAIELGHIKNYAKGRHAVLLFQSRATAKSVLALVEALEKAQRANAAQDDHINQQQDRIDQLEKGHQEAAKQINSWRRVAKQNIAEREKDISELDAARQRIADLESSTVTVKLPEEVLRLAQAPQHLSKHDQLCWMSGANWMRMEAVKLNPVAGIQVIEGEGQ